MTALLISHLAVIFICIYIAGFLLSRPRARQTICFSALCLFVALYAFGDLLMLTSGSLSAAIVAIRVEYTGVQAIAPFFLLSIIQLCHPRMLRKWMVWLALLYVAFYWLLVLTNDAHHLFYTFYQITYSGWTWVNVGQGPFYLINQVGIILCSALAYIILLRRFLVWTPYIRRRMSLIIVGSVVTLAGNAINVLPTFTPRIDFAVYGAGVGVVLFFICIRANRLNELVPRATDRAIDTMGDAMVVLNSNYDYIFGNDAALRLFPALVHTSPGTHISRVEHWPPELQAPLHTEQVNFSLAAVGYTRHFRSVVSSITKPGGDRIGWSVVMRDVTDTAELMEQLQRLAVTDPLTGLYNRRHFVELLQNELRITARSPRPMTITMFDIDHFKVVNDTYGHAAGDAVLVALAQAIQQELRTGDIFCRYGGEEFTIFSSDTSAVGAIASAERLRRHIQEMEIPYREEVIRIQASFGIVGFDVGDDVHAAIDAADSAMYEAKRQGRNRVELGGLRPTAATCKDTP